MGSIVENVKLTGEKLPQMDGLCALSTTAGTLQNIETENPMCLSMNVPNRPSSLAKFSNAKQAKPGSENSYE